jgi:hypothetical protein
MIVLAHLRNALAKIMAQGDSTAAAVGVAPYTHTHGGVGSPAPVDATYLTTTSNSTLSAEVVVGATPGGELGGTWASPTVDATHSGTAHAGILNTATVRVAAGVPSGAPTTTELPVAADTTAVTGGVYMWTGAAWVKVGTI